MTLRNNRDGEKITKLERQFQGRIKRVFESMQNSLLALAQDKGIKKNVQDEAKEASVELLVSLGFEKLLSDFEEFNTEAFVLGAQFFKDAGIDVDLERTSKQAVQYVNDRKKMFDEMQNLTRAKLQQSIQRALQEDISFDEYQKEVRSIFWLDKNRADLISQNEIGEAYSEGNQRTAKTLETQGVGMQKRWNHVGDKRVTKGCRFNQSLGWKNTDYVYESIDGIGKNTERPTRFPGCRCALDYEVQD